MTRTVTIFALAVVGTLAACNTEDHTIVAGGPEDPMAAELANAAPVELPPAIAASKAYRCKDNSLVYVDWLSDGSARVKADKNEVGTAVAAADAAKLGTPQASNISYNGKTCRV